MSKMWFYNRNKQNRYQKLTEFQYYDIMLNEIKREPRVPLGIIVSFFLVRNNVKNSNIADGRKTEELWKMKKLPAL